MSDINPTLDLIDGALHDWATSGDAMRWTPEPEQREEAREDAAGGLIRATWFDETHVWRENYQPERMGLRPTSGDPLIFRKAVIPIVDEDSERE